MRGQSVVQTGSRNESATTFPRRSRKLTGFSAWSTSWNGAATTPVYPGSVDRLGEDGIGNGVGGGDHRGCSEPHDTDAANRGNAAKDIGRPQGEASPPAKRALRQTGLRDRVRWRDRQPRDSQVAGENDKGHRDHAVGIGPDSAKKAEILDQDPVGEAEHRGGDDGPK